MNGGLDFSLFNLTDKYERAKDYLRSSPRVQDLQLDLLRFEGNIIKVSVELITPYLAAFIAEFVRLELLQARSSFTFETVMSHRSEVDILKDAQTEGYRTYLYFITTEDPEINCAEERIASPAAAIP